MNHSLTARLTFVAVLLAAIILLGSFGYWLIEGWHFFDSFYMTVITAATVGYGETRPLSGSGRVFTIFLIAGCLAASTISSAVITSYIVENDLSGTFRRRRTLAMIAKLTGHTIVCGAGRMGQAVIEALVEQSRKVVVIDNDPAAVEVVRRRWPTVATIDGSATDEGCLADANVLSAQHVVVALSNEMDNLLVAITCKDLGIPIRVFARSDDPLVASRMRKAGVDEVLSPSCLLGHCVAGKIVEGSCVEEEKIDLRDSAGTRWESPTLLKSSS